MTPVEVADKVALSYTVASAIVFSIFLLSVAAETKDKIMAVISVSFLISAIYVLIKYLLL